MMTNLHLDNRRGDAAGLLAPQRPGRLQVAEYQHHQGIDFGQHQAGQSRINNPRFVSYV